MAFIQISDIFNQKIIETYNPKEIPKICHLYWGNSTLPYLRYLSIISFKKQNPDWRVKLYVPKNKYPGAYTDCKFNNIKFTNKDYYSWLHKNDIEIIELDFNFLGVPALLDNQLSERFLSRQEVYRSDFLRWHLLANEGGLWSDSDIIYFEPIEKLNLSPKTHTLISLHPVYKHSVGFMLSAGKNNPYYSFILERAKKWFNPIEYQSVGVLLLNEDFGSIKDIEEKFPALKGGFVDIGVEAVYCYDALNITEIYETINMKKFTDKSIGIHWYGGHVLATKLSNEINHENFYKYDNVLTRCIKKAGVHE